ncbi:MAG TPA: PAS domain-containing protein [Stellaceae bacterium]|jgi:hypothetical protein
MPFREHTAINALLHLWGERCGDRDIPDRADFDPTSIAPSLLPHFVLADIVDGGVRLRFRLLGTAIVNRFGFDPTGKYLDETFSDRMVRYMMSLAQEAIAMRRPAFSKAVMAPSDGSDPIVTARIYMPLTHAARKDVGPRDVAMILAVHDFGPPWRGGAPLIPVLADGDARELVRTIV